MATNTVATKQTHTAANNASGNTSGPYTISFDYLSESDVEVRVDNTLKTQTTHYTFPSKTSIQFTSGNFPTAGAIIEIKRNTDITVPKVDFQDGSVLTESDLDNNSKHLLFGMQETKEDTESLVSTFVGATAPTGISNGARWYDSVSGRTFVYYQDVDTAQWVEASPPFDAAEIATESASINFKQANSTTIRTVESKLQDVVSVKDFGADSTGVNDSKAAIQAAIDAVNAAGGGTVTIPNGTFKLASDLELKSNVTVRCEKNTIISGTGDIRFTGSLEAEKAFTAIPSASGDADIIDRITLASSEASAYSAGDKVRLISVVNALNRVDAGEDWTGDGTQSLPFAYFNEFHCIKTVVGNGVFNLADELIFNDYAINAAGETETDRTGSAVQKFVPVEKAHWIGGTVNRTASNDGHVFRIIHGYHCSISDVSINRSSAQGSSIQIEASWNCEAKNITNYNDPTFAWNYTDHHAKHNRYKIISSQDCGFDNIHDSYGGQSVDFTYNGTYKTISIRPYCTNSTFTRCYEAPTSHPGVYQERWINNAMLDFKKDGLVIRGYAAFVHGNLMTSSMQGKVDTDNAGDGIVLAYGAAQRAHIANNVIRGSYRGIVVQGSSTLDWSWDNCLLDICNNHISESYFGFATSIQEGSFKNFFRFLNICNNYFSQIGRFVIKLDDFSAGVTIHANRLDGNFRATDSTSFAHFVQAGNNCPALKITDNVWARAKGSNSNFTTIRMINIASIDDTTAFPEADWACQTIIQNNTMGYSNDSNVDFQTIGTGNYKQELFDVERTTNTIVSGSVKIRPIRDSVYYIRIQGEGNTTDTLDQCNPETNVVFREGDQLFIRQFANSNDITFRDISTSGITSNGFQLPSNSNITTTSGNNVHHFVYNGQHWAYVIGQTTT